MFQRFYLSLVRKGGRDHGKGPWEGQGTMGKGPRGRDHGEGTMGKGPWEGTIDGKGTFDGEANTGKGPFM